MSLSMTVPPVQGAILANYQDEADRRKWTEELDCHLPNYKTSKRDLGRILKELKDIYCRPGCRGSWTSFLQSRGIAVRTAYDLIRAYSEESSSSVANPRRRRPALFLKLPQAIAGQEEIKAAIAKLGRERAAEVMFAALIGAAAASATASPTEEDYQPNFPLEHECAPESGGSAESEWRLESVGGEPMIWKEEVSEEMTYDSMTCRNEEGGPESGESAELEWRVNSIGGEPLSLWLYDLPERGRQLRIRRIRRIQPDRKSVV